MNISEPSLDGKEATYVAEAMESGWISSRGEWVGRFESSFARFAGTEHALATNTGTAALHLALLACGVGPGDEVIVPALTYVATANAVAYTGATVVVADVDPSTWTIDPRHVEQLITDRTAAIIAVHLFGVPADVAALDFPGVWLIEDAAEAHGSTLDGKPVGSLGDVAAFSFYGNKTLTTGEGGMVTTDNDMISRMARLYGHQGQTKTYHHPVIGYNYRMTNVAAAIGCAQLERAGEFIEARQRVRDDYHVLLVDRLVHGNVDMQEPRGKPAWWATGVLVDDPKLTRISLDANGIETRPFFTPIHRLPMYHGTAPIADHLHRHGIMLPHYPGMTDEDVRRVVDAL